ncbi:MAG: histidine--tRNA ligase [Candidatus Kapabacteria bacterium]|nr:histidine--tRNA ligase [Ignavibacteriota bacterium]MCW5886367.1 histidine--tRNA ligase [Candidatus Kapabacteria bacterium]
MIQSVRGTKDLLPGEIEKWQQLENVIRDVTKRYGYREIRTPIFEKTEVFSRSIGENTDIVNKEMYTFTDKGDESITLRPEKTAALVRSVIQNNLTHDISSLRLWYFGPFFRYERPQKGRLRQFHQFGAECIGSPNAEADAEIILLANQLINNLGIKDYTLQLNSLGNEKSRADYRQELVNYLSSHKDELSHESQTRLETNPLRVLDSKEEKDKLIITDAPVIIDFLDDESKKHFDKVRNLLNITGVKYHLEPRLVRGLDYYCHTVFEFRSSALGAQDAFGGGGRYDGLFEQLGGKPTPAVGFAMGIERLILILEALGIMQEATGDCDIYLICTSDSIYDNALTIAEQLRASGYKVYSDLQRRSFKAQMREADKLSAKYCVIIGEDEISKNSVKIKNMSTGEQADIKQDLLQTISFR